MSFRAVIACWLIFSAPVLAAAVGFGAGTVGGKGGAELLVTRSDDDPAAPQPGSLRWALRTHGPRVIRFAVEEPIVLQDRIVVKSGRVTVDGFREGGRGVTITGGCLEFADAEEIIVRHVRIRLGEAAARRKRPALGGRPRTSVGLDCLNLQNCRRVLLDHVTLAHSCDELLSVVGCRDVTAQWCLFAEPLGGKRLHPYGLDHACCVNASASTLSLVHCVFTDYRFRGPQFEANDLGSRRTTVRMEAVGCVMARYTDSGSRFTAVPDRERKGQRYEFQFIGNHYLAQAVPALEVAKAGDFSKLVHAAFAGNEVPRGARGIDPESARGKIAREPLFRTAGTRYELPDLPAVLDRVGCWPRDAGDARVLKQVAQERP